ncbi:MAG: metal-dependent hydrolase [Alicyclobacillus herbarius]|uniref:metal-dependent hydrolase n=1 Tax=Alicyclobacillus herbarius TaxID=122960 RepID=UPI00235479BD|nr:metal-dependent hydrolase [Alicyclobacillus herbarius]MCL6631195.1 metal-dependent hydrolase [Alicyclobacillus herbarius]
MDNVTHALCGLGIYGLWTAVSGHTALTGDVATGACLAAVVGSEAPDFDYAVRVFRGPVAYLRQHRALSHSVPAWFLWPLLVALVLSLFWPGHMGLFYLLALCGVLVHVGLDVLTSYGTQALWPFSKRRLAMDCLFIVDLVLLLCGFAGIALVVRGWSPAKAVFVCGGIACLYIAVRCLHTGWLYERMHRAYPDARHISVLPGPMPWLWNYVVQRGSELEAGRLTNGGARRPEVVWRQTEPSEASALALKRSRVGQVFRWFARHLIWTETPLAGGILVTMADATYRYDRVFPFTASVYVKRRADGRLFLADERLRAEEVDRQALANQLLYPDQAANADARRTRAFLKKP